MSRLKEQHVSLAMRSEVCAWLTMRGHVLLYDVVSRGPGRNPGASLYTRQRLSLTLFTFAGNESQEGCEQVV
jgi:hypothetical protein